MNTVEMWYERHLRLRKDQPAVIRFLLWVGFVKFGRKSSLARQNEAGEWEWAHPETIIWPFHAPPRHVFIYHVKAGPRVYRFRNRPGVIKRLPGRLLPMRWGFGVCGFEFGDRG